MAIITQTIELNPFPVPTGVTVKGKPGLRQDGFRAPLELKLSDLDPSTLELMCDEFRSAVFLAAGKRRPGVVTDDGR